MGRVTKESADRSRKPTGVEPPRLGLLMNEDEIQAELKKYRLEQFRRMQAIAEKLGIPDDSTRWYQVALALARKTVPELRDAVPKGARPKWSDYALGILAAEFERVKAAENLKSDRATARRLCRRSPWMQLIGRQDRSDYTSPDPAEALLAQYKAAKKLKFAKVARDAYFGFVAEDDLAGWHKWVEEVAKARGARGR